MTAKRVNFTLSEQADAALDALAAEDAGERRANRSETLERIIFAERDRRRKRGRGKDEPRG